MEGLEFLEEKPWRPFTLLGFDSEFLTLNADTIINTWIVLLVIIILCILSHLLLKRHNRFAKYIILTAVEGLEDLTTQAFGRFIAQHFFFISSLFIFVLLCNWISFLPFAEEPTKDLNTALALGFISFFYKEFYTIKTHGFKAYIQEFLHPFFLMFPLNVIGHFSKIISMSFRLFGNIFGGFIITSLYNHALASSVILQFLGLFSGINYIIVIFFTGFEGLIQAFVFTMLSLTYLAIAIEEPELGELT